MVASGSDSASTLRVEGSLRVVERLLVYHNRSCSKSRGALEILADEGVDRDVVEYLRAPPDRPALERIVDGVGVSPAELVRRGDGGCADGRRRAGACDGDKGKDRRFEELGLSASDHTTRDAVIELLLEHPELVRRPVVFRGERAVIARPSEKVLELLD
jgi:arsenate reductase (glutaredoxin)